jgi:hypothetical protein
MFSTTPILEQFARAVAAKQNMRVVAHKRKFRQKLLAPREKQATAQFYK